MLSQLPGWSQGWALENPEMFPEEDVQADNRQEACQKPNPSAQLALSENQTVLVTHLNVKSEPDIHVELPILSPSSELYLEKNTQAPLARSLPTIQTSLIAIKQWGIKPLPTPLQSLFRPQKKLTNPSKQPSQNRSESLPIRSQSEKDFTNKETQKKRADEHLLHAFVSTPHLPVYKPDYPFYLRPFLDPNGRQAKGHLAVTTVLKQKKVKPISSDFSKKPVLEPPRMGIYALYYILTKIGLVSDALSHWEAKQTLMSNDEQLQKLHKERLEQLEKNLKNEKACERWSVATKVFGWVASFMGLVTGCALMLTGVGAVCGALLVAGAVIGLCNNLLEETGAWQKIAEKLPGQDPEKKRAIISWIQIGLSVFALTLSAAGGICSGWTVLSEAMNNFMAVFGGVAMIGSSISTIGQGVTLYLHKDRLAYFRQNAFDLTQIKNDRQDNLDKAEAGLARLKQLLEDLGKILDFENELFRSSQTILRG